MKKSHAWLGIGVCALLLAAGVALAQRSFGTPGTIIHVVVIKFKPEATPEQQQKVLEGVKQMAATIPGIKNVWLKSTRVQPRDYHAAFVLEFADRAAADAYATHPAHEEWRSYYMPLRAESRSLQVTN